MFLLGQFNHRDHLYYNPGLLEIEHIPSTVLTWKYLDLLGKWGPGQGSYPTPPASLDKMSNELQKVFAKPASQSKSKYFQVSVLGKCSIPSKPVL